MTKFIAEVSSNHNKDIQRCFDFIKSVKDVGCGAIKFQLFKIDQLFAPEILENSQEHAQRRKWELPEEFIPELAKKCKELELEFGCTPFYLDAVDILEPYVDFLKIASYELLWDDLLVKCAQTKKPIQLSTGMANMGEVNHAVDVLKSNGATDIVLFQCVSSYPAPVEQCNLSVMQKFKDKYSCSVGWSDHSVQEKVIYRAVNKWQADVVEFHFDLEGGGIEFDRGFSWLPDRINKVIENVSQNMFPDSDCIEADGDGIKEPVESELADRAWRADPSDGLRPLLKTRKQWIKNLKQ